MDYQWAGGSLESERGGEFVEPRPIENPCRVAADEVDDAFLFQCAAGPADSLEGQIRGSLRCPIGSSERRSRNASPFVARLPFQHAQEHRDPPYGISTSDKDLLSE